MSGHSSELFPPDDTREARSMLKDHGMLTVSYERVRRILDIEIDEGENIDTFIGETRALLKDAIKGIITGKYHFDADGKFCYPPVNIQGERVYDPNVPLYDMNGKRIYG